MQLANICLHLMADVMVGFVSIVKIHFLPNIVLKIEKNQSCGEMQWRMCG